MNQLDRFEALAEWLVEGTFARLFAGYLHPLEVATHLARAMEDHRVAAPDGTLLAPTDYWIYLHPQDFGPLISRRPTLPDMMAEHVAGLAREAGLVLTAPPRVFVEPLLDVPPHSVRVKAIWQAAEEEEAAATREMTDEEQETVHEAAEAEPRGRPYLVVRGRRHVSLDGSVVSVGRALDNDIILEDRRVSRHHVQLRRRYGRYVLYDVGSSGGTMINDYPVQECVLHPGDVISLAGAEIIYGEDQLPAPDPERGDTSEMDDDRPSRPEREG